MSKETDEWLELRAYLLGAGDEQTGKEEIEKRLMTDRDYFQELLAQEEELIKDYVNDELSFDERRAFQNHFLISPDRREKLKFALLLKKHIEEESAAAVVAANKPGQNTGKKKWENFKRIFLAPAPVAVFSVLLVAAVLFWIFYSSGSNPPPPQQQALISLNKAYTAQRPFESRISDFNYAPFSKVRNDEEAKVNVIAQNRAERIALDDVAENPTAENLHLLARVNLAKKEFDKALGQLEEAQKKSPQNPEILSDTGAAYLEKSKIVLEDDEKLTLVAKAIESFDKALAINPNLLPAQFNKAMATEIYLPNRAREAWEQYLRLDQASDWANEAREHLKALNKQQSRNISSGEELESAFLKAYAERDDEKALQIASQNRELISKKYLPQRLSIALAEEKKTREIKSSNS